MDPGHVIHDDSQDAAAGRARHTDLRGIKRADAVRHEALVRQGRRDGPSDVLVELGELRLADVRDED
jgi:hypothetical protein